MFFVVVIVVYLFILIAIPFYFALVFFVCHSLNYIVGMFGSVVAAVTIGNQRSSIKNILNEKILIDWRNEKKTKLNDQIIEKKISITSVKIFFFWNISGNLPGNISGNTKYYHSLIIKVTEKKHPTYSFTNTSHTYKGNKNWLGNHRKIHLCK